MFHNLCSFMNFERKLFGLCSCCDTLLIRRFLKEFWRHNKDANIIKHDRKKKRLSHPFFPVGAKKQNGTRSFFFRIKHLTVKVAA